MNRLELLQRIPLFAALSADQIASFADRFRAETFAADTFIFLEGDPADRLWVVQDGQVKIIKHSADGVENILEVILPGEMFGGAGILFPVHPATAVAMTETATLSLEREEGVTEVDPFSRHQRQGIQEQVSRFDGHAF